MTPPSLTGQIQALRDQIEFIRAKAAESRKFIPWRRESAQIERTMTDKDEREAAQLAARMTGKRRADFPARTPEERQKTAVIHDRIADKDEAEARQFDAVAESLDTLVAALAEGSQELEKLTAERDAYRRAACTMHDGLVGAQNAGAMGTALCEEGVRLLDDAEYAAGHGHPDDLAEFRSTRARIEALEAENARLSAALAEGGEKRCHSDAADSVDGSGGTASRIAPSVAEDGLPAVEGVYMDRSIADFQRACRVHLAEEQAKPNPDTALIAVLCDAVRCSRELSQASARAMDAEGGGEGQDRVNLRQGCVCQCCDHLEGSDCACDCHSEGLCSWAALAEREAAQGWHPIDTAPQDGTPFRAYGPGLVHPDFNPWGQVEAVYEEDRLFGAIWDGQFDCWNSIEIGDKATHWQPFPPSPALAAHVSEGAT